MSSKKMTLKEIEKILGHKIQLVDKKIIPVDDVPVGDVFIFCGVEFVVLNNTGDGIEVIARRLHGESVFDSATNNYCASLIASKCDMFYKNLMGHPEYHQESKNGAPFKTFDLDLTTMDGHVYGSKDNCSVSLLSFDKYRQFVKILDKHRVNKPWALATAVSPKDNGNEFICCWDNKTNTISQMHLGATSGIRPYMIMRGDVVVEAVDD